MKLGAWFICDDGTDTVATKEGYGWARVNPASGELEVYFCTGDSRARVPLNVVDALLTAHRNRVVSP